MRCSGGGTGLTRRDLRIHYTLYCLWWLDTMGSNSWTDTIRNSSWYKQLTCFTCFSWCSPIVSASAAAPQLRPLQLLLPNSIHLSCCPRSCPLHRTWLLARVELAVRFIVSKSILNLPNNCRSWWLWGWYSLMLQCTCTCKAFHPRSDTTIIVVEECGWVGFWNHTLPIYHGTHRPCGWYFSVQ